MARVLLGTVGLVVLAGCTEPPGLPYEHGVGVTDIIRNVKCELTAAVADNAVKHPWLKTWAAGVELTLDVTNDGTGGVGADILVPIHTTDALGLGLNGQEERRARSIASVSFAAALAALDGKECATPIAASQEPALLKGKLGLEAWVGHAADAIEANGIVKTAAGVGYVIEFGLVSSGGR